VRDMPCRLTAVPPGAHAGAGPRPPVHGKLREHCVPTGMTRRLPLGRRHAAVAHTRAGALPSATGRSSAARLQPPCRPCHGSCWHDARAKLLATPLAYNPPPPGLCLARARVYTARRGELALLLALRPDRASGPLPNLHQSLPDHLWPSFPLTFAGNLAAAEAPWLPRRRPSPGRSPAKSLTPIDP
jgi:hypothetical protein